MSVGHEIVDLLETVPLGVEGDDLFLNAMPETPNSCGAVFETAGSGPTAGFGVQGIAYESPAVQIRFRGEPYDEDAPRVKIATAYRLLMQQWGVTLGSTKYLTIKPLQAPFILERDGNSRVVWVFNAVTEKELSVEL